jgi:hypothetical protein
MWVARSTSIELKLVPSPVSARGGLVIQSRKRKKKTLAHGSPVAPEVDADPEAAPEVDADPPGGRVARLFNPSRGPLGVLLILTVLALFAVGAAVLYVSNDSGRVHGSSNPSHPQTKPRVSLKPPSFEERCVKRWNTGGNQNNRETLNIAANESPEFQSQPGEAPTRRTVGVIVLRYQGPAVEGGGLGGASGNVVEGDCLIVGPENGLFAYIRQGWLPTTAIVTLQFSEFAGGYSQSDANAFFITQVVGVEPTTRDVGKLTLADPEAPSAGDRANGGSMATGPTEEACGRVGYEGPYGSGQLEVVAIDGADCSEARNVIKRVASGDADARGQSSAEGDRVGRWRCGGGRNDVAWKWQCSLEAARADGGPSIEGR